MDVPTQRDTLRMYAALTAFVPHWPGKFLLVTGLDEDGRTLALASVAAGAATLILEPDEHRLREARRDVTFTVTTLDEALRTLKNEVRQGRAIAVALSGSPEQWLTEMLDRGVQPDVIAAREPFVSLTKFIERGARHFRGSSAAPVAEDHASSHQERRSRDARLLEAHPEQRQWLAAAPSLFPRDSVRAYLPDQRLQPLP